MLFIALTLLKSDKERFDLFMISEWFKRIKFANAIKVFTTFNYLCMLGKPNIFISNTEEKKQTKL